MSKIEQAIAIVAEDPSAPRKDLIARFVKELGMTPAGASTYVATARKKLGSPTPAKKVIKEKAVDKMLKQRAKKLDDAPVRVVSDHKLERPKLDQRIVDVVNAMTDSEKKARIRKMVELADAVWE